MGGLARVLEGDLGQKDYLLSQSMKKVKIGSIDGPYIRDHHIEMREKTQQDKLY